MSALDNHISCSNRQTLDISSSSKVLSEHIAGQTLMIQSISARTNLLAMDAAIEAAHAGGTRILDALSGLREISTLVQGKSLMATVAEIPTMVSIAIMKVNQFVTYTA